MSTNSGAEAQTTTNRSPLLPRLDEEGLAELVGLTSEVSFQAGDTIFREGESGETAYIILAGEVRIWTHDGDSRQVTLAMLGPNDFFGELAVLDGGARSASATAEQATRLGGLNKEQVEQYLLTHPHAALHMIKQLGERLRQTNKLL